jgi:ADP-ribosyl-[dinitrogen reductase] hydrolase
VELAADVARATLHSPLVLDLVRVWAATLVSALSGATKGEILTMNTAREALHGRQAKPPILALLNGNLVRSEPSDGALSIVATALDVFRLTPSFEIAVRESARTSPSCAALAGSLAGAHYGPTAIPSEWSNALSEAATVSALARRLGN